MIKDKLAPKDPSGAVSLKQCGSSLRVEVSPKKEPSKGVTASLLIDWMKNKSLCLSQMKNFTQFIRQHFGRLSVEKYAQNTCIQYSHQLDDYFELVKLDFLDSEGQSVTKEIPIVTDPIDLVHCLHDKMDLDIHETFLKVGIDAGHGSLKVNSCMSSFIASYKLLVFF